MKRFRLLFFITLIIAFTDLYGQNRIAITLDDVPGVRVYKEDGYQHILLDKLDSLSIPIAIYINEAKIYRFDSAFANISLLENWISRDYMTLGNHSFSHRRYSEAGPEEYVHEILKGEVLTKEIGKKYGKPLVHFRFPYNDLGKDSLQQTQIKTILNSYDYQISPFTVESSDWMFNLIYEHLLKEQKTDSARIIGELYVSKTLEYIDFFDEMASKIYGQKIDHIYLAHDNAINRDYLAEIINALHERNYEFISMDKALQHQLYQQKNRYYYKYGVSWLYRWMPSQKDRVGWMKKEPDMSQVLNLYNKITNAN